MKISVSIVDYGKGSSVLENIVALSKQTFSKYLSIIVVDNSEDLTNTSHYLDIEKTSENFNSISIIRPNKNVGYTLGSNISVDLSSDFCILLNPDIIIKDQNLIEKCILHFNKKKDIGLIGVKHINQEGNVENIARSYPELWSQVVKRTFFAKYSKAHIKDICEQVNNSNDSVEVDWVQSSFWLMRTETWIKCSGLDNRYFLFMNEPDFCRRLKTLGYKVIYDGNLIVYSDGLRCSVGSFFDFFNSKPLRIHVKDALKYYLKHLK